ncbi:MAG: amidophosphoribosyltransferase [Cyanobacteria bacterium P01_H01_bin.74]
MIHYKSLNEACGVFGIMDRNSSGLGHTIFFGLYALQHRGQESCGMAVYDNHQLRLQKEMGLVNQVFNQTILDQMTGQVGIGHTRYSTTGTSSLGNAQPVVVRTNQGALTLAHNGNLTNTNELTVFLKERGYLGHGDSDSHVMAMTINFMLNTEGCDVEEAVQKALSTCEGAFSIVVATGDTLIAARDPLGLRPLCMGRTRTGALVFASETAALDIVGATFERDLLPGEIVSARIDDYYSSLQLQGNGVTTSAFIESQALAKEEKLCVFELVYFARPDSTINQQSVYQYRMNLGKKLAEISPPVEADIVIPVPDSGTVAAIGYSRASGIPFAEGLIKNRYVGRTFINPSHELREKGIQLKLNPLKDVLYGKRIVVVDDSIVRGNTSRNLVRMLWSCGVKEIHLRVSSAKVTHPCFYGIDMSQPAELIANQQPDTEAIRQFLGVTTLMYLSVENMVSLSGFSDPCTACFSGKYPGAVPA